MSSDYASPNDVIPSTRLIAPENVTRISRDTMGALIHAALAGSAQPANTEVQAMIYIEWQRIEDVCIHIVSSEHEWEYYPDGHWSPEQMVAIEAMLDRGMVEIDGDRIYLTDHGFDWLLNRMYQNRRCRLTP